MANKIRVQGDGTPAGTKVYVVTPEGTETDISDQIKSLTLNHNAGSLPTITMSVIMAEFNLTGTHRSKHDRDEPPSDPRTGMVRWV